MIAPFDVGKRTAQTDLLQQDVRSEVILAVATALALLYLPKMILLGS